MPSLFTISRNLQRLHYIILSRFFTPDAPLLQFVLSFALTHIVIYLLFQLQIIYPKVNFVNIWFVSNKIKISICLSHFICFFFAAKKDF